MPLEGYLKANCGGWENVYRRLEVRNVRLGDSSPTEILKEQDDSLAAVGGLLCQKIQ